ncbi:unnamed protein product [Camellia sinensis]
MSTRASSTNLRLGRRPQLRCDPSPKTRSSIAEAALGSLPPPLLLSAFSLISIPTLFPKSSSSSLSAATLTECFKDARNIELPCCNLRSEVPSQTENSNDVQDRANKELDFLNLIDNYSPPMQSPLNYQSEQYTYPQETTLPNDLGDTCDALPSSFTDLLSDCCTEVEQEPPMETTLPNDLGDTCEALPPSFTDLLADCFTEVEQEPPTELEEVDLKSQIAVISKLYMTTTSFREWRWRGWPCIGPAILCAGFTWPAHVCWLPNMANLATHGGSPLTWDMWSKLGKVITDMGGDLVS